MPSGLTITNGGGGVSGNKQSVGSLATSLAPGASVTYTVTATAKGARQIVGGVLSVRTLDPQLGNNLRTVRTTVN